MFHNLGDCDSHLIMQETTKLDVKIDVIPNGLEKYMENINLTFIASMQFMSSSLYALVKILSGNDFKYWSQEFSGKLLELVK